MRQTIPGEISKYGEGFVKGLAIDAVIFGFHNNQLKILIIEHGDANLFALPGGYIYEKEDLNDAAKRILASKTGLTSGSKKQVSYASQIWMVLANVTSPAEAKLALKNITSHKEAVIPGAPYLYHFFISALIESGLKTEAKEAVINYWGGMVKKGADTFWEVYDPNDAYLSPYHFFPINSYCHAWSCTPVYFIRKYPDIFQ